MIDARALAIVWLSSALLLAAGLAFGMNAVTGGSLEARMIGEDKGAAAGEHRVMPAEMPHSALPDWLRIDGPARFSC